MIGFAAVAAFVVSYQLHSNKALYFFQLLWSALFCASPCWLIYDICVGSVGGVLNESITRVSVIVSVVRYGWKNLGNPESGF